MKDKCTARIQPGSITSYRPDRNVMSHMNKTWMQIVLTIGSAIVTLEYETEKERNEDLKRLDAATVLNDG